MATKMSVKRPAAKKTPAKKTAATKVASTKQVRAASKSASPRPSAKRVTRSASKAEGVIGAKSVSASIGTVTNASVMDWLYDSRIDCYSVMADITIGDYLTLIRPVHEQRGVIDGQRDVLKTTTAKRIRDRMIADIRKGAILPPVVIGVVVNDAMFRECGEQRLVDQSLFLKAVNDQGLSIIDGMQRTASLMEAAREDANVLTRKMRAEFWIAKSVRALVYRMLVLNTGQVPWNLARQLSVVYEPLLLEVRKHATNIDRIFTPDSPGRRVAAGQFASDSLVEIYLAFSLRRLNIDTRESLSEEFSRLDFVDNVADAAFQGQFYDMLSTLALLDKSFSRYEGTNKDDRFNNGKSLFGSQPAQVGFAVAVGQAVLGRPGLDRKETERVRAMKKITRDAQALAARLDKMKPAALANFLKLDVLSEFLNVKVSQVGRHERNIFFSAFKVLISEDFALPNMEPCWRAGE